MVSWLPLKFYTIQIRSNNLIPSLNEKEVNLMVHEKRQCHCSRVFILVLGPVCGRITVFWNPDKKKNWYKLLLQSSFYTTEISFSHPNLPNIGKVVLYGFPRKYNMLCFIHLFFHKIRSPLHIECQVFPHKKIYSCKAW